MKPLDDLMKEDIDELMYIVMDFLKKQHNFFDYDMEEMKERVIKNLKEEK